MVKLPAPPSLPPTKKEDPGELTQNEYGFILDTCLKAKHRNDTDVIKFIDAFVACKNIQQASNEAGIFPKVGYSLRHRKDISNAIQKLIDMSTVKYGFDSSEVMERVKEVVDFDPVNLQNYDGTYKTNLHEVDPETRRCIKKLKVKNIWNQVEDINGHTSKIIIGELIEYDIYDKLKASELVGKEKEMFKSTTKVEHVLSKNMSNILLESDKRADARIAPLEVEGTVTDVVHDA